MAVATSTALLVAAAATAASAYVSYEQGEKARSAQEAAGRQATEQAKKQADQAEQSMNRANAKRPDTNAMLSANAQASKAGAAGTMLTGPMGIDPAALQLGKNTLLGG